ncbi:hypothetical protein PHMEG_00022887 [Phytophthora megakarya]|uniref:Uncharacterized protein n=1 Tax=Phytophthora megakarya TaxID=4795 RepID=A0A225VJA3_9STRA|nr:hypothetical protein PHMEG_00022887 [Phytophthora megakarya]
MQKATNESLQSLLQIPASTKKPLAWRVFLCEKKRHAVKGEVQSCFDIWHKSWLNGTLALAPRRGGKRSIRARAPARPKDNKAQEVESDLDASDESTDRDRCQPKRTRHVPVSTATD